MNKIVEWIKDLYPVLLFILIVALFVGVLVVTTTPSEITGEYNAVITDKLYVPEGSGHGLAVSGDGKIGVAVTHSDAENIFILRLEDTDMFVSVEVSTADYYTKNVGDEVCVASWRAVLSKKVIAWRLCDGKY